MSFYLVIGTSLLSVLLGYLRFKYNYWELQGVKQLKTHFLYGTFFKLKSIHLSELWHEVYQTFRQRVKIAGTYIFTNPIAVIIDLDLVKNILIKDFNIFVNRTRDDEYGPPIREHLFQLRNEKWRHMRTKLSPAFTSGKMKFMFPTIVEVANQLAEAFKLQMSQSTDGVVEIYDIMAKYTTDVIGTCSFGIECNSLRDPEVEFRKFGGMTFKTPISVRLRLFQLTYRTQIQRLGLDMKLSALEKFMMKVVNETVAHREQEQIKRNDFMNILLELKNQPEDGITIGQLAAQVWLFFVAGFETSSSNMSYTLYELAKNQKIQDKLRTEILEVLKNHGDVLTYEAMTEMPYLNQVITETLRKYPALSTLRRFALEDYNVPGTNITIEKGTQIVIPVKEIHYDPDIYDNPNEFRPERFDPEEEKTRHPQAFLGFGDGPRNCIGLRFGQMQVRIGLITLLRTFKFSVCKDKTSEQLKFGKYAIVLIPEQPGVFLKVEKLDE